MTTEIHEVLGHGSGRMADHVTVTPQDLLKEQYSALEETRADLVALYFVADSYLSTIGLVSTDEQQAVVQTEYEAYARNALVQLRRVRIGASVGLFAVVSVQGAFAQELLLQIRPRAGDTLRMRLDQETDYTGAGVTRTGVGPASLVTTMAMFSRAIVEGEANDETAVLAVTDSVRFWSTDQRGIVAARQMEARLRGQRVRFRVTPEGLLAMEAAGTPREVAHLVSLMPATFPKGPIKVGETWMREMPLPSGTQFGALLSGMLHVTLRLDSVTHAGELAFVSMRGEMQPASGRGPLPRLCSSRDGERDDGARPKARMAQ